VQKRALGKTGQYLSVIGFGGVLVMDEGPAAAARLVAGAIDRGINYFDVAPSYGDAEQRLGPALEPYRGSVFLACKTLERTREEAAAELQTSLERLRTDRFDLYQLHAVNTLEEVEQVLGPGGAIEALLDARQRGLVRLLGFSSHGEQAALAMLDRFAFDSVLFPINLACWHEGRFGPRLVDKALKKGAGLLGLKALAKRKLGDGEPRKRPKCWYAPVENLPEAEQAIRFVLSLPVTATVSPGEAELFRWACDAAERFEPLSAEQAEQTREQARGLEPIFSVAG
jgi:predicted aldo/keto reductase-like oxidoreductase